MSGRNLLQQEVGSLERAAGKNLLAMPEAPGLGAAADVAATFATGAIAEPIAGLAGVARMANPLAPRDTAGDRVREVRDALTVDLSPEGAALISRAIDSIPQPLREAGQSIAGGFQSAADFAGENIGPIAGAAVTAAPTAIVEMAGFKGAQDILRRSEQAARASVGAVKGGIREAAPSIDDLRAASRAIFKELDNSGVVIKADVASDMINDIARATARMGLDPDVTPKSFAAVRRLKEKLQEPMSLLEMDTLRAVADNAAGALEARDARLGLVIKDAIDGFLDQVTPNDFVAGNAKDLGKKYSVARELWGRAERSKMITKALQNAELAGSGFENGIRIEMRKILRSDSKAKFFTEEERKLIRGISDGVPGANIAKLIGRVGWGEGGATNLVGATIGATAGGIVGGATGAVVVPVIGVISRKLSQRLTQSGAMYLDDVIRAGKDGKKITLSYFKHTPKSDRNPAELAQLLMRAKTLPTSKVPTVNQAIDLVRMSRNAAGVAAGVGAAGAPSLMQDEAAPPLQ